jgi:flagellar basal body P-ring protein FlgI
LANFKLSIDDKTLNLMALSMIEKEIPVQFRHKFKSQINLNSDLWSQVEQVHKLILKQNKKSILTMKTKEVSFADEQVEINQVHEQNNQSFSHNNGGNVGNF